MEGEWSPKTKIGKKVKSQEITELKEILEAGKPILEPEIVDVLLPELKSDTLSISTTQRTTDSGRKMKFRAIVVVGDGRGYVGIGSGKSEEIRPAIGYATRDAKKNIVHVKMGCGSWECRCGNPHSIPQRVEGKMGSTSVVLFPAPKGVGLAANDVIKKVMKMAGVKDIWSSTHGNTSNIYNTALATLHALNSMNNLKPYPKKGE
ncbi:30S ribosomal protein S5 [Candidatus Micrarchaeota archaeon]|nr:30S ribosomal protein S5 [Candidatus Micrarchaeota archaeon]